jgi:hypothetical protein
LDDSDSTNKISRPNASNATTTGWGNEDTSNFERKRLILTANANEEIFISVDHTNKFYAHYIIIIVVVDATLSL